MTNKPKFKVGDRVYTPSYGYDAFIVEIAEVFGEVIYRIKYTDNMQDICWESELSHAE